LPSFPTPPAVNIGIKLLEFLHYPGERVFPPLASQANFEELAEEECPLISRVIAKKSTA
jgi:hypothetical protein